MLNCKKPQRKNRRANKMLVRDRIVYLPSWSETILAVSTEEPLPIPATTLSPYLCKTYVAQVNRKHPEGRWTVQTKGLDDYCLIIREK